MDLHYHQFKGKNIEDECNVLKHIQTGNTPDW